MTTCQMNVRMDANLKEAGDKVFEKLGLSPSQVVRAVWEYAVRHGDVPGLVERALQEEACDLDAELRVLLVDHDADLIGSFRRRWAPSTEPRVEPLDCKALLEETYADRYAERACR